MTKKVLLISIPHYYKKIKMVRVPGDFPLGLGYIARTLVDNKIPVEVLDINAHQYDETEVLEKIKNIDADIIGISAFSTQYNYIKWIAKELKKRTKAKIVAGGPLCWFSPEVVLKNTQVDICVTGEGDVTMLNLVKNLDNLKKVKGIFYKQGKKIVKNPPQPYIEDLDSLPLPAWDLFPMEVYLKIPGFYEAYGTNSMNIVSARGCPFDCNFCSKTFQGVRLRSADNIMAEIKELQNRYKVTAIQFTEELVLISKDRMYELCKKLKPLKIKWVCQGRVNFVDLPLLKAMKDAGCVKIGYGIESGSQKILDNMNKAVTVETAEEAIKNTRKAGLVPIIQMMYGYPGETKETLKETVDFCKRVKVHPAGNFSITTPLPGTKLYRDALAAGLIKDEAKYLEKLEGCHDLLVNFTDFSREEFFKLKNDTEMEILKNYIHYRRTHPWIWAREYWQKLMRFYKYVKAHGLREAIRVVRKAMKEDPYLVFNAEYK